MTMNRFRSVVAGIATTAALVGTLAFSSVPASAAEPAYPADGPGALPDVRATLPLLDGTPLTAGVATAVALPGAGVHSALVRLTLTRASADTTVDVAGFPALFVASGTSASATVLAPVRDGKVDVRSSTSANVRVEAVARFTSGADAPGALRALDVPAVRADSAAALAVDTDGLGAGDTASVGILGAGGVPEDAVRAAFVAFDVRSTGGATVELDGQTLTVPAGGSVIHTLVTPDASGAVDVGVRDGSIAAARLAVLGFAAEPTDNPAALQGPGSLALPASTSTIDVDATVDVPTRVDVPAPAGSLGTLALLASADTEARALSVLDIDATPGGRTAGAVVDGTRADAPQLVWIDAGSSALARGADVTATLIPVAHVLGAPESLASTPTLAITAPDAATIDATGTWSYDFRGTLTTPGDTAQRIEVTLNGEPHGSAHLTGAGTWSFTAALPDSGAYEFGFALVTRGGARTATAWTGEVIVPAADEIVVTPETVVLDASDPVIAHDENSVTFAADPDLAPGDVIVIGVTDTTPAGLLARVVSIDVIDGRWVVRTETATLTDVFLQADVDETLDIDDGTSPAPTAGEVTTTADGESAEGVLATTSWTSVATTDEDFAPRSEPSADDTPIPAEGTGPAASVARFAAPAELAAAKNIEVASISQQLESEFTLAKGVTVQSKALVSLALQLEIDIEVAWTSGSVWPPAPPLPYPNLKRFATVLESTASVEASAEASVSAAKEWSASKEYSREFHPIHFQVGPVPVVITTQVDLQLEAALSIEGNAKIAVETQYVRKQRLGFQFAGGKASLVNPAPTTTFDPPAFTEDSGISASFSASAGPTLSFTAKLWDFAGPQIGVSLKVALDAEASATVGKPFVTASAELAIVGGFFVNVLVTVPIIDLELVNATLLDKEHRWVLWSGTFDLKNFLSPGPPKPGEGEQETDHGQGTLTPAPEVLDGLDVVGAHATGAFFVEGPPFPSAFAKRSTPAGGFPTEGDDYIAMSTGSLDRLDGIEAQAPEGTLSTRGALVYDVTTIRIDLDIPQGVNCMIGFDFRFYSDEYPEYVNSQYNDAFVAEFGKTSWEIRGTDVYAPRNFAFDELGNPITINAAGAFTVNAANAAGTPYDGATSALKAKSPVVSGPTSLYLSIFDQGDGVYDSAVFIDRIEFSSVVDPAVECSAGTTQG